MRRYYDPELGYIAQAFRGKKNPPAAQHNEALIECEQIEGREFVDELIAEAQALREGRRLRPGIDYGLRPVTRWRGGAQVVDSAGGDLSQPRSEPAELRHFAVRKCSGHPNCCSKKSEVVG